MRPQRLSPAVVLLTLLTCVCDLAANDSKQPEQYVVSTCICIPSQEAGGKGTAERRIEFPQILAVDSKPCEILVGGSVELEENPVTFGRSIKLRAERLSDGRIKTRFNVELSNAATFPIEDLDGTVVSVEASRFVGVAKLTPHVTARIHCRGQGNQKTWLEMTVAPMRPSKSKTSPPNHPSCPRISPWIPTILSSEP